MISSITEKLDLAKQKEKLYCKCMKLKLAIRLAILFVVGAVVFGLLYAMQQAQSANMTSVSVRLSTPRLSFRGELNGSNTVGSSVVYLETAPGSVAAGVTSTSSANLFEGDTVLIGASQYKVASVSGAGAFTITGLSTTPGINTLQTGDSDDADQVIATRSASLSVGFTTVSAITDGTFRVLVPAASSNYNDSLPDSTGWDYGTTVDANVTVTCPTNITGYTFSAGTGAAGSVTRDGVTYHAFECAYTGAGGNGSDFTLATNPITIDSLVNPSPASDHSEGYADTYKIIVEQLDSGSSIIDQTTVDVAVIESVRVTASVPPQITFRILGLASAASYCGITTSVPTTPTLVPLGELLIDSFKYAAQELVVSTNANNGYTVTASADNQLHRVGETCVGDADESTGGCIKDSEGDTSTMTHTTADLWTSTATKGFGFTLADNTVGTSDLAFEHNSSTGGCNGASGNCWRQFADLEDSQSPQTLFSSSTVVDTDSAYVCYKAIVSATQQAGSDYSTAVTYRATASF